MHHPNQILMMCLSALALSFSSCATAGQQASPSEPTGARRTPAGADGQKESDAAAVVRSFVYAYDALGSGDLDGAISQFPTTILWRVVGASSHTLSGRDELIADWKDSGPGNQIALARVFLTASNILIAQGVRVKGAHGAGFVTIGTIEGSVITDVKEFRTSSRTDSAGPSMPADIEIVSDDGDVVNRITAEGLRSELSRRDWIDTQDVVGADVVHHNMSSGETTQGVDAYRDNLEVWTDGFPDLSVEILRSWAVGDFVIIERHTRGTNTAKLGEIAATRNIIDFEGLDIYRFSRDKIIEIWSYDDGAKYTAQIE